MAKIDIKFAELHSPLFLVGTNHGLKLHNGNKGMALVYDDEKDMLYVFYKEQVALVKSYASLTPEKTADIKMEVPKAKPVASIVNPDAAPKARVKAQVSGPQEHVFQGPGSGKARD